MPEKIKQRQLALNGTQPHFNVKKPVVRPGGAFLRDFLPNAGKFRSYFFQLLFRLLAGAGVYRFRFLANAPQSAGNLVFQCVEIPAALQSHFYHANSPKHTLLAERILMHARAAIFGTAEHLKIIMPRV
ncbi:MAG: hypothetical protein WC263_03940 [Candidatus Micrarchaeia archaeon]